MNLDPALIDPKWMKPTPAEAAALAFARKRRMPLPYTTAEMILVFREGFGYYQLCDWIEKGPPDMVRDEISRQHFVQGAALAKMIVDQGYNEERGRWWLYPPADQKEKVMNLVVLLNFASMVLKIQNTTHYMVAASLMAFFDLALGRGWQKQADALRENPVVFTAALLSATAVVQPCINPFCTNGEGGGRAMVDRTKKKSGACSKACLNYQCSHPDCVARAQANGWKRPTHPWGSKIADQHKEYRVE